METRPLGRRRRTPTPNLGPPSDPTALRWSKRSPGWRSSRRKRWVSAVTPPYTWGPEFLDQCWLVVKRAFIPLMFCTPCFSWGAPGISAEHHSTLATPDRLGSFAIMASVRELATWINGMGDRRRRGYGDLLRPRRCARSRRARRARRARHRPGQDTDRPTFLALGLMTVDLQLLEHDDQLRLPDGRRHHCLHSRRPDSSPPSRRTSPIPGVCRQRHKVCSRSGSSSRSSAVTGAQRQGRRSRCVGRSRNQAVVISFCLNLCLTTTCSTRCCLQPFPQNGDAEVR